MSHLASPRHKAPRSRRVFAVGGAAVITTLSVGGAVGLVPTAAVGQHLPSERSGAAAPADSAPKPSTHEGGGGWLTIEPHHRSGGSATSSGDPGGSSTTDVALPAKSGSGKRIVFSMTDQRVWLVAGNDHVVRTYLVSGSVHDNLQPGSYDVYSKSRHATSYEGSETMDYMVRFTHGTNAPIGFHDIPRDSAGKLVEKRSDLGTPQSAGCIRQWAPDARALWRFAPEGTTVLVLA